MTEEEVKALIKQMIADGDISIEKLINEVNENTDTSNEKIKIVTNY